MKFEEQFPELKGKMACGIDTTQNNNWVDCYLETHIKKHCLSKQRVEEALSRFWERITKGDNFEWSKSDAMDKLKEELGL